MPVESDVERACIAQWVKTDDPQDLLVLADYIQEYQTERERYEKLLRELAAAANPAVRWFFCTGPTTYNPKFETPCQGRLREAACLAWTEAQLLARVNAKEWRVRWEEDWTETEDTENGPVAFDSGDHAGEPKWRVYLEEASKMYDAHGQMWNLFNALGGIDLEPVDLWQKAAGTPGVSKYHRDHYRDGVNGVPMFDWAGKLVTQTHCSPYCRVVQAILAGPRCQLLDWLQPERDPPAEEIVVFREYTGVILGLLPCVPSHVDRHTTDNCVGYQMIREKSVYRIHEIAVPYDDIITRSQKPGLKHKEQMEGLCSLLATERNIKALVRPNAPKNHAELRAQRRAAEKGE